ncbi:hypothetical protein ACIP93_18985 [Streptomyces sp. NPDC088745]|uniref:hypothetical protein n=1 Tax=Streptomyces sp. NPDC088745 TaxID=3365884 RepID=UPI00380402F8
MTARTASGVPPQVAGPVGGSAPIVLRVVVAARLPVREAPDRARPGRHESGPEAL